jgi:hypothetical protein
MEKSNELAGVYSPSRLMPGALRTQLGENLNMAAQFADWFTGGDVKNATYRNHGTHAEAIEITFDPSQTSFRDLLEFFFQIHDPTTPNRQGNDRGASYRSAIFYTSQEQRRVAEETIADVEASGLAGQGGDRAFARWRFLGGGARAPGLPGTLSERLHLPLRPPAVEVAAAISVKL